MRHHRLIFAALSLVIVTGLLGCAGESEYERLRAVEDRLKPEITSIEGVVTGSVAASGAGDGLAVSARVRLDPALPHHGLLGAIRSVRATVLDEDVTRLGLDLRVVDGEAEHWAEWMGYTASDEGFDAQVGLWTRTLTSGEYKRVNALSQPSKPFLLAAIGWVGEESTRPSVGEVYRDLTSFAGQVGLGVDEIELTARPTDRIYVTVKQWGPLPDELFTALDSVGALDGVQTVRAFGRGETPHMTVQIFVPHGPDKKPVPLTTETRERVLKAFESAGLLSTDLVIDEFAGDKNARLWPAD